jgi:hypothetical protein
MNTKDLVMTLNKVREYINKNGDLSIDIPSQGVIRLHCLKSHVDAISTELQIDITEEMRNCLQYPYEYFINVDETKFFYLSATQDERFIRNTSKTTCVWSKIGAVTYEPACNTILIDNVGYKYCPYCSHEIEIHVS